MREGIQESWPGTMGVEWTPVAFAPMQSEGKEQPGPFYFVGMMVLMIGIFYMILIRPQRRREQERRKLLDAVKTGDRVLFAGGILGSVSNVKEKTLVIRIAEKVKIEVSRGAVTNILDKDESPPDPQEQK